MSRRLAAGMAAILLCVGLAGCTADEAPPEEDAAPLIVPGRPGEEAKVVPGEQAGDYQEVVQPNAADFQYMTMMIPHHQQALTMTDLVPDRAASDQLKNLADRMAASQEAEIRVMESWLQQNRDSEAAEGGHGEHQHGLMPGMATEEQLEELRNAKGAEFDRLFLQLMITHHEGALTMAEEHLVSGIETRAVEMAQEIITGQTDEIGHMRTMLGT
ncbi:DUF305 domain-containing protein [Saccharomonospora sp. NPDC046836]|uniref:DUF305 domain-containing protein n=1 Tax=Saccharomonospora sp. NPDC046836 TaxID=3156921 RepID=UPI0033E9CD1B